MKSEKLLCLKHLFMHGGLSVLFIAILAGSTDWYARVLALDDKKLKVEEVIARHLDSIGSAEARAAARQRVVIGKVTMTNKAGASLSLEGETNLISTGPKVRFAMAFPTGNYPAEDFAFDGNRLTTALLPGGRRSNLADFINSQSLIIKDGLLGGVLSTAWTLSRVDQLQPKLNYRGLKKVDGRQLHELSYTAKKGNDGMQVEIQFEPETFRHVRTHYYYTIANRMGSNPDQSSRQLDSVFELTEFFDDFRKVDNLTLPHKYTIRYRGQATNGQLERDWSLVFSQISHQEVPGDPLFIIK